MIEWEQRVKLRGDAMRIVREGRAVFVDTEGHALTVSPHVAGLWPLLHAGISPAALVEHLRERQPAAKGLEEQVHALFVKLHKSALLDDGVSVPPPRSRSTLVFDRIAGAIAPIAQISAVTLLGLLAVAVASIVYTLVAAPPRLSAFIGHLSWLGVACVLFVVIPLHELAHGVAARAAGLRIAEVGVTVRGLPRLFVRIPGVITATPAWRVVIAAAGPALDLAISGLAAWIARTTGSAAANTVHVWTLLGALAALSPLIDGDGARLLEGALGDEHARRSALGRRSRFTTDRAIRIYRAAIVAHLALAGVVLWRLVAG